ncbi:MAG: hypothetical protein Q9166_005350 [cf. Caloplaca sp. 2 TL-2023]
MADSVTPRRVLQDLPVNTSGISKSSSLPTSTGTNLKRQIHEVEDPALAPVTSRARLADCAKSSSLKNGPISPGEAASQTTARKKDVEVVEGSTQYANTNTASELVDSDMECYTMDTQQTAAMETSQATQPLPLSRAETLRLRLRVALFKVQTDQTYIPVSQLRIPSPSPGSTKVQPRRLLPAPVLKPSVRFTQISQQPHMLSSPPVTRAGSPNKAPGPDVFRTPSLPLSRVQQYQQLSSPPDSQDGGSKGMEAEDSNLSSSAVKGHAAISLLDLRVNRR